MKISYEELHGYISETLQGGGCDVANAEALADFMAMADRDGCRSHGIFRLPGYMASLRSGKVDGKAEPRIEMRAPASVHCDGGGGFAPLALWRSLPRLAEAAAAQGTAALALSRIYHFSALWIEVSYLAERGFVAFAFTSSYPFVAAAGGKRAFFGTNPMAFGWPRASGEPLVFDQASATLARGDIMVAAAQGHSVHEGAGLDKEGRATTNPQAILEGGVQLAFGGYKGSNLALMIELLAGALVGETFSFEAAQHDNRDGGPSRGGEFIMAIDAKTLHADFAGRGEVLLAEMLREEGVRLPSAARYKRRHAAAGIVDIDDTLWDKVKAL